MIGYFHTAYFLFHTLSVKIRVRATCLGIEHKGNPDLIHLVSQGILIDPLFRDDAVDKAIKSNGAVHGSRINVDIANLLGQILCHRAFAA